jgi:hypothetical protein
MPRYKIGDIVSVEGLSAKVVWLSENANEIEAIDEYIVEFEDRRRRFVISSELRPQPTQSIREREHEGDSCCG